MGKGGTAPRWPRRLPRRHRRARPVLLPPPDRVSDQAGRGGDPRSHQRADPVRAPARRRVRVAARFRPRRRDPRRRLARARRRPAHPRLPPQGPRRAARRPRVRLPGRWCQPPLGVGGLGDRRRCDQRRAARDGRGRARLLDRPSRRRLPAPRPLLRGPRARPRAAPRDRRAVQR